MKHVISTRIDDDMNEEIQNNINTFNRSTNGFEMTQSYYLLKALKFYNQHFNVEEEVNNHKITKLPRLNKKVIGITGEQLNELLTVGDMYSVEDLCEILKLGTTKTRRLANDPGIFEYVGTGQYGRKLYKFEGIDSSGKFRISDLENLLKPYPERTQEDIEEFVSYYYDLCGREGYIESALKINQHMDMIYDGITAAVDKKKLKYFKDLSYFAITHELLTSYAFPANWRKNIPTIVQAIGVLEELIRFDDPESPSHIVGNINERIHWNVDDARAFFEQEYLFYAKDDESAKIEYINDPEIPVRQQLTDFFNTRNHVYMDTEKSSYPAAILEAVTSLRYGGIFELRYDMKRLRKKFQKYGKLKLLSEQNWRIKNHITKMKKIPLDISDHHYDVDKYKNLMNHFYNSTHYKLPYNKLGLKIVDKIKTYEEAKQIWDDLLYNGLHAMLLDKRDFIQAITNLVYINPAYDPFIESYEVDRQFGRVIPYAFGRYYLGERFYTLCTIFSSFLEIPKALVPLWFEELKINIINNKDFMSTYTKQ